MTAIPVEQLLVGATILLPPDNRPRTVTAIERYEDGSYVVVYACNILNSRDNGRWQQTIVSGLEKTLRSMNAGELVEVAG